MMMRFNESPAPPSPEMLQPGFENKIMHATFRIGTMTLMASDGCNDKDIFGGFRLALTVDSDDAAQHAFAALSAGGRVDMPLAPTFFSPCYGMLTDKFGIGWMVMVPGVGA
jgi:PhnB protein